MILLQTALRNTRRARRAWAWPRNQFWVESLLQGDFVEDWWKENFRISRRTFEYIVRVVGPDLSKRDTKLDRSLSTKSCKWNLYWKIQCLFLPDALFAWESRFTRSLHDRTKRFVENVTNTRSGSEILPSHKRIYLSSRPWLPTVTLLDHRVITTFTLVKFPLSSAAFTKVSVGVYTRKMFPW